MEYFLVYGRADGEARFCGSGLEGTAAATARELPEDLALLVVPREATYTRPLDLKIVRAYLCGEVDTSAETFRSEFITAGSGQAITYLRKEQEAAAYLADPLASVPMLAAEAAAIGVGVADLAAEVAAAAANWLVIGTAIEAARRCAKIAITGTDHLGEMAEAASVDWQAAIAGVEA